MIYVRNWPALLLGLLFATATAAVLLHDVRSLDDLTIDHLMTLMVLLGTIAAGHLIWPLLIRLSILSAMGCLLLFLAGTSYCVISSAARNAEMAIAKQVKVTAANSERQRLLVEAETQRVLVKDRTAARGRECASGNGDRCKAHKLLVQEAETKLNEIEAALSETKPTPLANAGLAHAAKTLAELPWVQADAKVIERAIDLLFPFLKSLFMEIATLVFLSIGLGHREERVSRLQTATVERVRETFPAVALPVRSLAIVAQPSQLALPSPGIHCGGAHPVLAALSAIDKPVSNIELARIMGCSAGESSKRLREVANEIRITRDGKRYAISRR